MPSPSTVSIEVPYAESEQQFLVLAVQAAVKTFRTIQTNSCDRSQAESCGQASFSDSLGPLERQPTFTELDAQRSRPEA